IKSCEYHRYCYLSNLDATVRKINSTQFQKQNIRVLVAADVAAPGIDIPHLDNEIRQAAEFLELPQLLMVLESIQARSQFMNSDLNNQYKQVVRQRLEDICLFADVMFELDDGSMPAHRAILTARCDMMKAMFSGDFRESSAKVIVFPGVREYTFHKLLCYLYTDEVPAISLCLPRLVNLVESRVIEDLERLAQNDGNEGVENCLRLLEPCKLHNADQLADWYLKDYDYYQKCFAEQDKEIKPTLKRNRNHSGCLCFSGTNKSRRAEAETKSSGDTTADRPLFDASTEVDLYLRAEILSYEL
ncbi:hypothetical protein PV326_011917, partial [Microctonus aethiopoides]